MLSLLRSEWYQVRKALSVKIAFVITLFFSLPFGFDVIEEEYFAENYTSDQRYLLFGGGFLSNHMQDGAACLLIASLFAGWLIGSAFENRTIQNAVSYGKGRAKVFLAKMISFIVVVTGLCLAYWFGGSFPAFLKNGLGTPEVVGNLCHIEYIAGMVFAGILAYSSLFAICGVVGFWCQKSGITMGLCFVGILFGGNMLASIAPDHILKVINYTPLGLYKQVLDLHVSWMDMIKTGCISMVWFAVICGIGLWSFKKSELK